MVNWYAWPPAQTAAIARTAERARSAESGVPIIPELDPNEAYDVIAMPEASVRASRRLVGRRLQRNSGPSLRAGASGHC